MVKRLTMLMGGLILSTGIALAQTTVTGKVVSQEDGEPIIGASVRIVGTKTGTATDVDGNFTLPNASKDVVSEVFADVLDGKTQLGLDNETTASDSPLPSTNAGSYLLVCVRHKCLNLLSRQKMKDRVHHLLKADTSPSIAPLEATIAEIDRETEKYEAILAYMDAELTPQTRKVLDLRFRQKLKYREIATELGISEVAVYKHLAQGIRKLKQKFNP